MTATDQRPREDVLAEPAQLADWQLRVCGRLARAGMEPVTVAELRDLAGVDPTKPPRLTVTERQFRGLVKYLTQAGVVRPAPCPRCPRCGSCGSVRVADVAALHRLLRWSRQHQLDTAYKTRHVADAP